MTNRDSQGYTFIEILIVVFIISLMTNIVMIQTQHLGNYNKMKMFSYLLKSQIQNAREHAIFQRKIIGLHFGNKNYEFFFYNTEKAYPWSPLKEIDNFWNTYSIPGDITINIKSYSFNEQDVIFFPSGDIKNFSFVITVLGSKKKFTMSSANGDLELYES